MECIKIKYASQKIALLDIAKFNQRNEGKPNFILLTHAYLCNCGSWHISSRNDFNDAIIEKLRDELEIRRQEILSLKKEIQDLNKQYVSETTKEAFKELRKEDAYTQLRKQVSDSNEAKKKIQMRFNDVIALNIQLQNHIDALQKEGHTNS